jgi:hypothetical protein
VTRWTGPHWLRPQEADEQTAYCRDVACQAPICWREHPETGRPHPVDPEGGSHFATCPSAARFRQSGPALRPLQQKPIEKPKPSQEELFE